MLLLPEALATLAQAARAARIGEAAGRETIRLLNTGYVGSAAFHPLFSALINAVAKARPSIMLSLGQLPATEQLEKLTDHRLDLGIARSPLPALDPALAVRPLAREQLVMALPKAHPRALDESIALADFADDLFIQFLSQRGGGLRVLVAAACRAAGFEPRIAHTVPQIATMSSLVGAGLGVALVPETMTRLSMQGVLYRPLRTEVITELCLLYRRADTAPAVRAVLQMARRLAQPPEI